MQEWYQFTALGPLQALRAVNIYPRAVNIYPVNIYPVNITPSCVYHLCVLGLEVHIKVHSIMLLAEIYSSNWY